MDRNLLIGIHVKYILGKNCLAAGDIVKIMMIAGSIILPLIMFYSQKYLVRLRLIFNLAAIIALLVFGNIATLSIYKIIKDNTVFMTAIHAVFLNPFFLIAGSYIGIYILYGLLLLTMEEQQEEPSDNRVKDVVQWIRFFSSCLGLAMFVY